MLTIEAPGAILGKVPAPVLDVLMAIPGSMIAGGALRDWGLGLEPKDIDLFADSKITADRLILELVTRGFQTTYRSPRADTLQWMGEVVQVIFAPTRMGSPHEVISTFDFRCCQAALYYNDGRWWLYSHDEFGYTSLTRTLVYASPRTEVTDPVQSIARAFRFVERGWTLPPRQLAIMLDAYRLDPGEIEDLADRCMLGSGGGY